MRDRELDSALGAANPYGPRRVAALPLGHWREDLLAAVAEEPLPAPTRRRPGWRATRLAPALLVLLLLATATAFTSPGRAVTGWVGAKLGFGEPGGPPSLRQFNQFLMDSNEGKPGSARVLVVGPTPGHRRRYELIVYETKQKAKRRVPRGPCFRLDLTQERGSFGQGCGVLPRGGDFAAGGVSGNRNPGSGLMQVSGRVSPAVTEVEATYRGRPVPVQLRPVPPELVERFDLGTPFGFFIGFFHDDLRGGPVEVTVRGAAGEVLGHSRSEVPNAVPVYRQMCRRLARDPHPNPKMLAVCHQALGPREEW